MEKVPKLRQVGFDRSDLLLGINTFGRSTYIWWRNNHKGQVLC